MFVPFISWSDMRWFPASLHCLSLQDEDDMGFGGTFLNLQKVVDAPIMMSSASGEGAHEVATWSDEEFIELGAYLATMVQHVVSSRNNFSMHFGLSPIDNVIGADADIQEGT